MSSDNRTMINDAEANTGWLGDDTATATNLAGQFFEGSNSLSTQLSNVDEHMYTTEDSVATGAFSLDWSDSTLYMIVKDNLQQAASAGGIMFVIGDTTNRPGYDIGGRDAPGMPLSLYFFSMKLDVSVIVASPGTFNDFLGTEANMVQTACTQIGYGSIHAGKAQGPVDNVFMDAFRYIANDSYALTINGGVAATPETMTDVVTDDIASGWGMVSNPVGSVYYFGAPTEWGEVSAATEHAFTADGEQWYLFGDNGGGHAVGATHFPFRVIGNGTGTGSFILINTSVVNLGTRAQLLLDNADVETLEIDSCSFTDLGTISAPSSGGTSRFMTNTIFNNCNQITHNGADMSDCSVLDSNVVADTGAILYNETADPDGEMDNMIFSMGAASHHAIDFGASVTSDITLRGIEFTGFGTTEDGNDAALRFLAGSGSLNCNLIDCTVGGASATSANLFKDDAAGIAVTLVFNPRTVTVHVDDEGGTSLENARVYLKAEDALGDMPFEESVTIARSGTVATVTHTGHGMLDGEKVKIEGITGNKAEDNAGVHTITYINTNSYSFVTADSGDTTYTGSIISTGVLIEALTTAGGDATFARTWALSQPVDGFVRKSSASPRYKTFNLAGNTVLNTADTSINVRMVRDD